jgi:hypothetical protein
MRPPSESAGPVTPPAAAIEVRVENTAQLFNSLDPFPYPQRDLAKSAEDFIVSWARELPSDRPIRIVVHLPAAEAGSGVAERLQEAFANYFRYGEERIGLDLKDLFRIGRISLAIGLVVLAICVIVGQFLAARFTNAYLARFFYEGLIILGWVANWRPIEVFFYDWWPLMRRRNLYRRLAAASVEVKAYPAHPGPESGPPAGRG